MAEANFITEVVQRQKKEQKETAGWLATVTWIGSGIYLFATTPQAHFFSLKALVFFGVGMFAAAVVLGLAMYAMQRSIAWLMMKVIGIPGPTVASLISLLGLLLLAVQIVVVYLVARQIFFLMI